MTTENNKLIALFMNNAIVDNNNNHKDTYNYHNDWNWLMEVVEKIETTNTKYTLQWEFDDREEFAEEGKYKAYWFTLYPKDEILNSLTSTRKQTRIEAVYNACVEFIKWYSENSAQKE